MKAAILFIGNPQAQIAKALTEGLAAGEWHTTITQDAGQAKGNELVFVCLGAPANQATVDALAGTTPYVIEYESGDASQLKNSGVRVKESIRVTTQKMLWVLATGNISKTDKVRVTALAERAMATVIPKSAKRDKKRIRNYDQ